MTRSAMTLILALGISPGWAVQINGVSSHQVFGGDQITISGSNFGVHNNLNTIEWMGPNIESGTLNTLLSKTTNKPGASWDSGSGSGVCDDPQKGPCYSNAHAHSGSQSLMSTGRSGSGYFYDVGQNIGKIYVSYWARLDYVSGGGQWKIVDIQSEKHWGDSIRSPGFLNHVHYNTDGSPKNAYLINQCCNQNGDENTHPICYNNVDTHGNDNWGPGFVPPKDTWFRVEQFFDASSGLNVRDGEITHRMLDPFSPTPTLKTTYEYTPMVTKAGPMDNGQSCNDHHEQDIIGFENWIGNGLDADAYIDDIFIQEGTEARVELCRESSWANRTHCEIQVPSSWNSSSINITVNQGAFNIGDIAYLYVIDDNGNASNPLSVTIQAAAPQPPNADVNFPELPKNYVDTTFNLPVGGTKHYVRIDCTGFLNCFTDFQAALDAAQLGDIIEMEANAEFKGSFRLRKKTGTGWIYIVSSKLDLLAENRRVQLGDEKNMATLVAPNASYLPALSTDFGAHHYRIAGIEIRTDNMTTSLVMTSRDGPACCGDGTIATETKDLPSYIIFDRVLVHSSPLIAEDLTVGIGLNGLYMAVIDSHIANVKDGPDSQAILGFNGDGPYKIVNNFLEGGGENVMFGGNDAKVANSVPSDIEIRGNYFYKNPAWQNWPGEPWNEKNLLELKNAQRVLIRGNIFENSWQDAQKGYAIVFTPRNQGGTNPWAVVQDVTFENNIIRNTGKGFLISGEDNNGPSQQTKRILISHNLLENVSYDYTNKTQLLHINTPLNAGDGGMGEPVLDLTVSHNTLLFDFNQAAGDRGLYIESNGPDVTENFVYQDNITAYGNYGIGQTHAINLTLTHNVIFLDPKERSYTNVINNFETNFPGNFKADTVEEIGFEDYENGNYKLATNSPFKGFATDQTDPGVDFDGLMSLVACVTAGTCNLPPIEEDPEDPEDLGPGPEAERPKEEVATKQFKNIFMPGKEGPLEIECKNNIKIFDRRGQFVKEMNCGLGAGHVDWDGLGVSSGIYIIMEVGKGNRKVVVIK